MLTNILLIWLAISLICLLVSCIFLIRSIVRYRRTRKETIKLQEEFYRKYGYWYGPPR